MIETKIKRTAKRHESRQKTERVESERCGRSAGGEGLMKRCHCVALWELYFWSLRSEQEVSALGILCRLKSVGLNINSKLCVRVELKTNGGLRC